MACFYFLSMAVSCDLKKPKTVTVPSWHSSEEGFDFHTFCIMRRVRQYGTFDIFHKKMLTIILHVKRQRFLANMGFPGEFDM